MTTEHDNFAGLPPIATWSDVVAAVPSARVIAVVEPTSPANLTSPNLTSRPNSSSPADSPASSLASSMPIVDLTDDSRQVVAGCAFACVRGANFDGHRFAAAAVADGATALIVDHQLELDVAQLVVDDVRRSIGWAAAAVHGYPARELTMIGITGTNGKTTTSQMIATVCRATGSATAAIGTLSGARTTPEAADLQRDLRRLVNDGTSTVVMEVSSHALAMHRVDGIRFDVAVFTNLGLDHLDLHGSVDEYFRAKAHLFTPELCRVGVINADDPRGQLLIDTAEVPIAPYAQADLHDVRVDADRIRFERDGVEFDVPIGGRFNVANLNATIVAAEQLGIEATRVAAGLAALDQVPGRFEVVSTTADDVVAIVDYAHTPDGIAELLRAVRDATDGRVTIVFGCGGDRDQSKRPLMGRAAAEGADSVIVTSDNPRSEDPQVIIDATVAGVPSGYREALTTEPDRRRAIELAFEQARRGDTVVVAGRGHETTQPTRDGVVHFDDREVTRQALSDRRGRRTTDGVTEVTKDPS